jgi:hypothetical protein
MQFVLDQRFHKIHQFHSPTINVETEAFVMEMYLLLVWDLNTMKKHFNPET